MLAIHGIRYEKAMARDEPRVTGIVGHSATLEPEVRINCDKQSVDEPACENVSTRRHIA